MRLLVLAVLVLLSDASLQSLTPPYVHPWHGEVIAIGESHDGAPVLMPMVGLGTWRWSEKRCSLAVESALHIGYRSFDTALSYGNQRGVAAGIKASNVSRSDVFITSKIPGGLDDKATDRALSQVLEELNSSYVDLVLLHFPSDLEGGGGNLRVRQWKKLEQFYKQGRARAIGVSHFCKRHIQEILDVATVKIAVNQVQYHVGMGSAGPNATDDKEFIQNQGIVYQSFSPLCGPCSESDRQEIISGPLVSAIGERHGKSGAQVSLKWIVQQGIPVIPKSDVLAHVTQNLDLFTWSLSASEMKALTMKQEPGVTGGVGGGSGDCDIA